jgi:hypothetical protein
MVLFMYLGLCSHAAHNGICILPTPPFNQAEHYTFKCLAINITDVASLRSSELKMHLI